MRPLLNLFWSKCTRCQFVGKFGQMEGTLKIAVFIVIDVTIVVIGVDSVVVTCLVTAYIITDSITIIVVIVVTIVIINVTFVVLTILLFY